jgi:hypothetical protein
MLNIVKLSFKKYSRNLFVYFIPSEGCEPGGIVGSAIVIN